jgi:hypothetical protein
MLINKIDKEEDMTEKQIEEVLEEVRQA